jgi:hypothetical protein
MGIAENRALSACGVSGAVSDAAKAGVARAMKANTINERIAYPIAGRFSPSGLVGIGTRPSEEFCEEPLLLGYLSFNDFFGCCASDACLNKRGLTHFQCGNCLPCIINASYLIDRRNFDLFCDLSSRK